MKSLPKFHALCSYDWYNEHMKQQERKAVRQARDRQQNESVSAKADAAGPRERKETAGTALHRLLCGVAMGVGGVLPGVSGGILAVSMGVYEKLMLAIGNFFLNVRKNTRYLLPLVIGGGIGVLLTSNLLSFVIERYETILLALFSGLVLGSMPELFGEVRAAGRLRAKHWIAAAGGLAFVLLFALGESSVAANEKALELSIPSALIAGAVLSVGTIIPGISSSFILVYLGLYHALINAISGVFDLSALARSGFSAVIAALGKAIVPLLFVALGFGAVSLVIIKAVNRAIARHHSTSYAAVIGFVLGSIILILPSIAGDFNWVCVPAFLLGLAASVLQYYAKRRLETRRNASCSAAEAAAQPAGESAT